MRKKQRIYLTSLKKLSIHIVWSTHNIYSENKNYTSCFCAQKVTAFFSRFLLLTGTLIQIRKFPYMFGFIWKQYPKNLAFLILRIIELFTREGRVFLKK